MPAPPKVRVLFVCLGNICRSPLAEGVFTDLLRADGLDGKVEVDSAGTGAWHAGQPPDRRMRNTALRHGISIDDQRARQIKTSDLDRFDVVLAMDGYNRSDIEDLDRKDRHDGKIRLFRDFDPEGPGEDVPDPYYGDGDGFERVYAIVARTSRALLDWLKEAYDLQPERPARH